MEFILINASLERSIVTLPIRSKNQLWGAATSSHGKANHGKESPGQDGGTFAKFCDAPDSVERKLAAILAADVAGYSRLMENDEAGTLSALSEFLEQSGQIIAQRNGYIANTAGDSILAVFPSVTEALEAAVEMQQSATARAAAVPPP